MPDFLEERISGLVRMGASYVDDYAVDISVTSGGQEYPRLVHPFPVRRFDVSFMLDNETTYRDLQAIYHRAHGKYAGFRVRCHDEWSSNGRIGVPTPFDQPMGPVAAGVYQLRKYYGTDQPASAAGYAYRNIRKPVAGTVRVAIGATEIRSADWAVDTTTGIVTFVADISYGVTGISKGAQTIISMAASGIQVGHSIVLAGVVGMTEINGLRGLVVAKDPFSITVSINSAGFSNYVSGGTLHTNPQAGELITAGYQFDFPVRFNTSLPIGMDYPGYRSVDGVELIERINP